MPAPVLVVAREKLRTQPEVLLAPKPAAAFRRADAAWREKGHNVIDVNSSARSYTLQLQLHQTWVEFDRNRPLWRKRNPGKSDPPFALHPDASKHVQGEAIDSDDHSKPGFITHMADYGWIQTAVAIKEPWHLDYIRSRDNHIGEPAGGGSEPLPINQEDDDMTWYVKLPKDATLSGDVRHYTGEADKAFGLTQEQAEALSAARGIPEGKSGFQEMSVKEFRTLLNWVKENRARTYGQQAAAVVAALEDELEADLPA